MYVYTDLLRQIVETGYFHCDPHPGNLCVSEEGKLVYYDFGMMDELRPNVREGFRQFCVALFAGGPMIDDLQLAQNARQLVDAVETMGVNRWNCPPQPQPHKFSKLLFLVQFS